jgi:ketosteroid isomerase-like protein
MVSLVFAQEPKIDYKKIVHTFNEAWNTGNYDLLDKVVHPKYFKEEGKLQIIGIAPLKEYVKNFRKSMPDAEITYIDEIYGSEKAAILFTLEGTPVETRKKFKAEGIVIFRFVDGKIIEDKSVFDQLSSLKQQGYTIIPPTDK